jgi:hypothetical protein
VSKLTLVRADMHIIRVSFELGFREFTRQGRTFMVRKCANRWCATSPQHQDGKLFRLDFDLGNMAGGDEQKTEYIWLCAPCAKEMRPKVEVIGNTVTVRLSRIAPLVGADTVLSSAARVN